MKKFNELIKSAVVERQVEDLYISELQKCFSGVQIMFPYDCDGILDTKINDNKDLKLICEFKYDKNLKSKLDRAIVIIQVLYYLKRFENNGETLPNVCLIGDKNECFVFHTNDIISFLDEDCDWNIAPSCAHDKNRELLLKLADYDKLNPFVFDINEDFSFNLVADKIKDLSSNIQRYIHITEHNIDKIYAQFIERVIKNSKKYNSKELVNIFLGIIKDHENYFVHPVKKNTLCTPNGNIDINSANFESFFSYFQKNYTPQEIVKFTEIADRLIEDTERRNSGDFWTPTLFVDYANKMISEQFGEDWKENYVVWDCACGSKNLTRDYYFKELYCSTLFDSELEIGKNYNKEATSFQFDFLNDYFPMPNDLISEGNKVPEGLVQALKENKPFIFFINPPYGTAGNIGGSSKKGINFTNVRKQMREDGLGAGAENLQHQFLYRICKIIDVYHLTNVKLALFSNPVYLSGGKQKDFLKFLCNHFSFLKGIMFCAAEFANVSPIWGITFNLWESGKTQDIHNFMHALVEKNEDNNIIKIGKKNIYNAWNCKLLNIWLKELNVKTKYIDKPTLTSSLNIRETDVMIYDGAIGYFNNHSNTVMTNSGYAGIYSSTYATGHGVSIFPQNFNRCMITFTARELIEGNWINSKDEYLAPNEQHTNYIEFELDSIIYSLFNASSNQSSLRNVEYKGKTWNIKNEFFFLSKDDILNLANENSNNETYNDARTDTDRFVYKFIEEHKSEFSAEALEVLQAAKDLVYKSFKYRQMFNEEEPKYQINNWDCGWYQIKALCKMFCPNELKEFQTLYKKFSDKLRPMVYELGFLKKE